MEHVRKKVRETKSFGFPQQRSTPPIQAGYPKETDVIISLLPPPNSRNRILELLLIFPKSNVQRANNLHSASRQRTPRPPHPLPLRPRHPRLHRHRARGCRNGVLRREGLSPSHGPIPSRPLSFLRLLILLLLLNFLQLLPSHSPRIFRYTPRGPSIPPPAHRALISEARRHPQRASSMPRKLRNWAKT